MSKSIPQSGTEQPPVVLLLQVPRTNDKKELAAEQMFASLYGLLTTKRGFLQSSTHRQHISLEIAVLQRKIGFYVWVPSVIKDFVEDQIYAQYPNVQISEVADYSLNVASESPTYIAAAELRLNENQALPIKTFQSFEVDPLAAITGTLAKFNNDEQAWIQLIIRPATANWHRKSEAYVSRIKGGYGNRLNLLGALWSPPDNQPSGGARQLAEYEQTRIRSAEEKSQKLAYETCIRIVYISHNPAYQTQLKLQSITASFHQFNSTYLNGFSEMTFKDSYRVIRMYQRR